MWRPDPDKGTKPEAATRQPRALGGSFPKPQLPQGGTTPRHARTHARARNRDDRPAAIHGGSFSVSFAQAPALLSAIQCFHCCSSLPPIRPFQQKLWLGACLPDTPFAPQAWESVCLCTVPKDNSASVQSVLWLENTEDPPQPD